LCDETREKLKAMKGFRNILVHRYGRIDDNLAYEILNENLRDFYPFMEEIENLLEQKFPIS